MIWKNVVQFVPGGVAEINLRWSQYSTRKSTGEARHTYMPWKTDHDSFVHKQSVVISTMVAEDLL